MKPYLTLFILISIVSGFMGYKSVEPADPISPVSDQQASPMPQSPTPTPSPTTKPEVKGVQSDKLNEAVTQALNGVKGSYGVYVKNLKTGEIYTRNAEDIFETASLYKLWVMGEVYDEINDGHLEETKILSQTIPKLNELFNISDEYAELTEGSITQTVQESLDRMITISDNYSALLLAATVRNSNIQKFLIDNGFSISRLGTPPVSNAEEIATFLEKMYRGKLVSKESSEKMLDLLRRQKLNTKIPKYIPVNIVVAHKTGELGEITHDAGIVFGRNGDYIIVVLSQSDDPDAANERIAGVSKAVYDHFEK